MQITATMIRLEELSVFSEEMERILRDEQKRLAKRVNKVAEGYKDPEVRQTYLDDMGEDWDRMAKIFPTILRTSVFARCISDFEHALFALAKRHGLRTQAALDLSDLRGEGFRKVELYLVKVIGLPFPSN